MSQASMLKKVIVYAMFFSMLMIYSKVAAAASPARQAARVTAPGHIVPAHKVSKATDASVRARARIVESYGKLPLSFEANQGQIARQVKFLSRGAGYTVFLTANDAVLALSKPVTPSRKRQAERVPLAVGNPAGNPATLVPGLEALRARPFPGKAAAGEAKADCAIVRMQLVNANAAPKIAGVRELPGKSNYLIGNNPKDWRTNVPTYARVKYQDVYPGVNLVYHGNQRRLEYDFVVAPGANPGAIRLRLDTRNSKIRIAKNGDLKIETRSGVVSFRKPVVYQPEITAAAGPHAQADQRNSPDNLRSSPATRRFIDGRFALLSGNEIGFKIARYDKTKPLVIDPTLAYATYLATGGDDAGTGLAVDSTGAAYVTGTTSSADFPTMNAYQATQKGSYDAFVTKLNATGTALVYSTFIGGSNYDSGRDIAVDSSGTAYITGYTLSTDFPTAHPIQSTNPGTAAFVAKLNAAGNGLVYSTFLAGSGSSFGEWIAVDSAGSAYVTGNTTSTDFPTVNAVQSTRGGGTDAFVAKLNPAGTALTYSTYLGGSGYDAGFGIAVDSAGYAYVTGNTTSSNFPTRNALQATPGVNPGAGNAFVAKLAPSGSPLVYSTYLGGSQTDYGLAIAADSAGAAYVTGMTTSTDFPTMNPIQTNLNGTEDAYVTKLSADGSALVYSTYLGGGNIEYGYEIAVDSTGSAYVAGDTNSTDFPTVSPLQASEAGDYDAFLTELNPAGDTVTFSTYLGGTDFDEIHGIALDSLGAVYITGYTTSADFPTTSGAYQTQAPTPSNCVKFPSGYIPFTQITSNAGGEVVVGYTTLTAYNMLSSIPLPSFPNEPLCGQVELAPGQYFYAYDPTAAERQGEFSSFSVQLIDPTTSQPFLYNIIPPSELGGIMAWPIGAPAVFSGDAFVAKVTTTPQQAAAAIANQVNAFYSQGALNSGQDISLVQLLQQAGNMASSGKIDGAIGNLVGFINEVNGLLNSDMLTPEQAASLTSAATALITQLQTP